MRWHIGRPRKLRQGKLTRRSYESERPWLAGNKGRNNRLNMLLRSSWCLRLRRCFFVALVGVLTPFERRFRLWLRLRIVEAVGSKKIRRRLIRSGKKCELIPEKFRMWYITWKLMRKLRVVCICRFLWITFSSMLPKWVHCLPQHIFLLESMEEHSLLFLLD